MEISLGNALNMITVVLAVGAGIFEGGMIRSTLEDGIRSEQALRETEIKGLSDRISEVGTDVRDLRHQIAQDMGSVKHK